MQRIQAYNILSGLNAVRIINPHLANITAKKDAQVNVASDSHITVMPTQAICSLIMGNA